MKDLIDLILSAVIKLFRKKPEVKVVDPVEFNKYKTITDAIVLELEKFSCITLDCKDRKKVTL